MPEGYHPTVVVTEPSTGHAVPFAVAIILFALSAIVSIWIAGPPL
jgi:hypothetical protein